jgi:hypothetical protein
MPSAHRWLRTDEPASVGWLMVCVIRTVRTLKVNASKDNKGMR